MTAFHPLRGARILSLALNLPGPAALMRLRALGAKCVKVESPAGDPMQFYSPEAYAALHEGIKALALDLKTDKGQVRLHKRLEKTDVLLTSFRPSALDKLGLSWKALRKAHPHLSLVAIVGAKGARAEEPGHDLTYIAEAGLIQGLELPATLFADMGGASMASEAVVQAVLMQREKGKGVFIEVALNEAANWLALPRTWKLTTPEAQIGGAHAGYRVYACQDGRIAVAALEPHFAKALCAAAGIAFTGMATMLEPATHEAVAAFFARQTCKALARLAVERDIPLHVMVQ
jgi:crotonobetainyl-CoA:carnitine CoA-transferase CaiB-like acyl-CoA transferase